LAPPVGGVMMRYFKVLDINDRSCNGGSPDLVWSLPVQNEDGTWTPGEWMPEVQGNLELCANGYHLTDTDHLLDWLNATIYEAEPSEELIEGDDKIVCRSVRLLRKMHWDDRVARLFACDCAERVLPIYERDYPDDKRPRHVIEVARLFAEGKTSDRELDAARDAARDAAGGAAWDAAWSAAWSAAWDAAWGAAWNAARAAACDKERKWQIGRLMKYLEGK
jgi:hypothetical protein